MVEKGCRAECVQVKGDKKVSSLEKYLRTGNRRHAKIDCKIKKRLQN
jgi:hypothetical protein